VYQTTSVARSEATEGVECVKMKKACGAGEVYETRLLRRLTLLLLRALYIIIIADRQAGTHEHMGIRQHIESQCK